MSSPLGETDNPEGDEPGYQVLKEHIKHVFTCATRQLLLYVASSP